MNFLVRAAAIVWLSFSRSYARKWSFMGVFALVFLASVILLGRMGLLPDAPQPQTSLVAAALPAEVPIPEGPQMPLKIEAPSIALSASVENPDTTAIPVLDEALKHGAVRYPTSARLGENGNVVLFGHSSYLPIVFNPAYKTFNGIQKLSEGDTVIVYSPDTAYTYRVKSVSKESANNAGIPLEVTGRALTLATCDSFGKKTDRFVVVADFVESHAIRS